MIELLGWLTDFVSGPKVGAISSVIGMWISVRVWFSLRDIRRKVLFRQRAPEAINAINNHASVLSTLLQDYDANGETIDTEVALSLETLKAVVSKLQGPAKDSAKRAIVAIEVFRKTNNNRKTRYDVRQVYTCLLSASLAIENMLADAKQEL